MDISLREQFENTARQNGAVIVDCESPRDVGQYVVQVAESEKISEIVLAPPPISGEEDIAVVLSSAGINCVHDDFRRAVLKAPIGVTGANGGIAETGSLLLDCSNERTRLASCFPQIHIAVLQSQFLVKRFQDTMTLWNLNTGRPPKTAQWTLISGPSRAFSLEDGLKFGIQGPRELHILLI